MTTEEKAAKIVSAAQIITLASITEDGYPRPVAMVKIKEDNGVIYVSTGTSSAKTKHFKANPKAGISIVEEGNSIVMTGVMEIVEDPAVKRSLWADWMLDHFPGGQSDPNFCILKFTPQSSTYWIDNVFMKDHQYMNRFCQSCGMPMPTDDVLGTEADGSKNSDYCMYCYENGAFTCNCSMDEMIEISATHMVEQSKADPNAMNKEQAIAFMKTFYPRLKRWAEK